MKKWIAYGKSWDDFNEGYPNDECCVPGTQIETADGNRYLIGDINRLRGTCDDCRAFSGDVVVVRYRLLLTQEEQNRP